jgi:hypothetical protein
MVEFANALYLSRGRDDECSEMACDNRSLTKPQQMLASFMKIILANGLPILLNMLIENPDALDLSGSTESACAFYYCYFARNQDETTHFLRWVISELCRRIGGIPARIHTEYKDGLGHLVEGTLLSTLEAAAEDFSRIYMHLMSLPIVSIS